MNDRTLAFLGLVGIIVLVAGVSAFVMISSTSYMNQAAAYAAAHQSELSIPDPLPNATPYAEPPVKVEAVARYGQAVEVQITRRFETARHPEALFTVTYFFQPAAIGWQLVPFPASFWGEPRKTTGTYVTILHPQRDQKLIDNLIKVIDPAIESACDRWACPPAALPITMRFVTDSAEGDPAAYLTPRLSGLPMSREANDDYLSHLTAQAIIDLALKVGKSYDEAYLEIQRQNLYVP